MPRTTIAARLLLVGLTVAATSTVNPVSHAYDDGPQRPVDEIEVHPRTLDKGARPAVSWLAANVVHTPSGRTQTLPWGERAATGRYLTLRGRTPAGWVTTDHEDGVGTRAWVVDAGDKRQVDLASESNDEQTWMVARDGTALLRRSYTSDFASVMVTRLSDGETLANEDFEGDGQVLDFTGPQALLGVSGDTVLWEPGGDQSSLGVVAVAGDITHDVLVVPGAAPGTVGPTSLSDPGAPTWAARLDRVEVSPDGRSLVGLVSGGTTDGRHIEVRRLSDGTVRAAYHVRNLWRLTVQWETPRSIIFLAARTGLGDVNGLVRCHLDRGCTRATAWRQLRSISTVQAPRTID